MSPTFGDTEDDVTLRGRRMDERRGKEVDDAPADREVTLNTGTVLALFFTLALICAVFFGFGYSMGRKSNQPAVVSTSDSAPAPAPVEATNTYKPSPGSPVIQPVPGYQGSSAAETKPTLAVKPAPAPSAAATQSADAASAVVRKPVKPVTAPDPAETAAVKPAPTAARTPAPAAVPVTTYNSAVPTAGITYVQIAAVSHREDADVLLSALQRRGYKVLARTDTADKLIHVQIGPFTDRKQAEVTRQKLLGDGYNAFLK
ncbi:sporulation related protein [Terriglobus roseus DSM 18391]|uniref:Sporulation related protein n=1 Tax=Terriglobus roseus (strain DSM 18391 / NRRL B-41598 / KBS 63) TaxID=926566 RepID=I3ZL62_TERRK|nr:SPOR domain-containing protein [Terriglobus roseus]AFL89980.1 sporulation related protein [Terriglobus roseus DSM 18391]